MKILKTKSSLFRIEQNSNGTLDVYREYSLADYWQREGCLFHNAGLLIKQHGGMDNILSQCEDIDDIQKYVHELNVSLKQKRDKAAQGIEKARTDANNRFREVFSNAVTECTVQNISVLLRWLNFRNWGTWGTLPNMSIGYSCHQHNCGGRIATTIKLDKPIEYHGEWIDKFQHGAPKGYLNGYTPIRSVD